MKTDNVIPLARTKRASTNGIHKDAGKACDIAGSPPSKRSKLRRGDDEEVVWGMR